jgi:hypothetical protein
LWYADHYPRWLDVLDLHRISTTTTASTAASSPSSTST